MKKLNRLLLAAAIALPMLAIGCGGHTRVYAWGPAEGPYYSRWEVETHHDHMEWESRNEADRNAYWEWRKHHH